MALTGPARIINILDHARRRPHLYRLTTYREAVAFLSGIGVATDLFPMTEMTDWLLSDGHPKWGGPGGIAWMDRVAAVTLRERGKDLFGSERRDLSDADEVSDARRGARFRPRVASPKRPRDLMVANAPVRGDRHRRTPPSEQAPGNEIAIDR